MNAKDKKTYAPPIAGSPLRRMSPVIATGLTLLTTIYYSVYYWIKDSSNILGIFPPPAEEYCVNSISNTKCLRPDLFAFQCASCTAIIVCGSLGFLSWHVNRQAHTLIPDTPEGRIFAYLPSAELLCAVNFTFQLFDFFISLGIPEHATAVMLTHHLLASTVSFLGLAYTYLHYYAIFFLGLSEVSSIFLVFVDLARFFPPLEGTSYHAMIYKVAAPAFVLCFLFYRVVLWWPVSIRLYRDAYRVIRNGQAARLRPNKSFVLGIFIAINIPLGVLQLYWARLIVKEVQAQLL